MKVFINRPTGGYVGGLIVAAANSTLEAHGAMCAADETLAYWYRQMDGRNWRECPLTPIRCVTLLMANMRGNWE